MHFVLIFRSGSLHALQVIVNVNKNYGRLNKDLTFQTYKGEMYDEL